MPTYYPKWSESTWGKIAAGAWTSPGYIETTQATYALHVINAPRNPTWDPDPPPPPDVDAFLISQSDWSRIRFGTLDAHDPTVIHKDQSSYKVQAIDNGVGARTAVVVAV